MDGNSKKKLQRYNINVGRGIPFGLEKLISFLKLEYICFRVQFLFFNFRIDKSKALENFTIQFRSLLNYSLIYQTYFVRDFAHRNILVHNNM